MAINTVSLTKVLVQLQNKPLPCAQLQKEMEAEMLDQKPDRMEVLQEYGAPQGHWSGMYHLL